MRLESNELNEYGTIKVGTEIGMVENDAGYICLECAEPLDMVEKKPVGDSRLVGVCDTHGIMYAFEPGEIEGKD